MLERTKRISFRISSVAFKVEAEPYLFLPSPAPAKIARHCDTAGWQCCGADRSRLFTYLFTYLNNVFMLNNDFFLSRSRRIFWSSVLEPVKKGPVPQHGWLVFSIGNFSPMSCRWCRSGGWSGMAVLKWLAIRSGQRLLLPALQSRGLHLSWARYASVRNIRLCNTWKFLCNAW